MIVITWSTRYCELIALPKFFPSLNIDTHAIFSSTSPGGSQILEIDIMQPSKLLLLGSLLIPLSFPTDGST